MENLKINKKEAIEEYPNAPLWFQKVLISTFGTECFAGKIMDRVKTFEDACRESKISPFDLINDRDTDDEVAYKKLKLIIKVINEGWEPDWNNSNQKKWYPWFNLSPGFGFASSDYYYGLTITTVGSRLCFETEEKSTYVAKQFLNLYETLLTIK